MKDLSSLIEKSGGIYKNGVLEAAKNLALRFRETILNKRRVMYEQITQTKMEEK